MSYSITRTKIIPPRRHKDLLSRQRLLTILDDLLEYRLTLIIAPAGYGKTSLLVDLAAQAEYPVCWLALDPLDHDPLRFMNHFIAAIHQQFPDFGGPSRSLLNNLGGSDLDMEQALRTVINDIYNHIQEHFALILDDFYLIDSSPDINQFINRFTQETDENCHLVITSRSLLNLPDLPHMIGRSQVHGLSYEELAFHSEEFKELYKVKYQQELSDQDAERIVEETEGWITGFLLSAETIHQGLTNQGHAARAAGINLYDYLAQQVLEQQPQAMQDFLLRTSLLEEFNERLCQQALSDPGGGKSWGDLLQQLHKKNLFIQPVENEGTWLRYHHLFRDFLQQHFQSHYPDQARILQLKMVEVYQGQGWLDKAYAVCRKLGDEGLMANYIKSVSPDMFHTGQISTLKTWLDDLSPTLIESNPDLLAYRSLIACNSGNPKSGLWIINQALAGQSGLEDSALAALLHIRRATCHRLLGGCQQGLDDALKALQLTKKTGDGKILEAEAEREIGLNQYYLGQTQEARSHLERSLVCYLEENDQRNAALVEMDLGFMETNEGRYPAARSLYQQAYHLWEGLGNFNQLVGLCNNLGVLDYQTGDYREAINWYTKALDYAQQTSNLRGTAYTLASLADLALDFGAFPGAENYLHEAAILADETGDTYLQIHLLLTKSGLARRRGQIKSAREQLDNVYYQVKNSPPGNEVGKYHLENGLLLREEKQLDQAYQEFKKAREIFSTNNLPVETSHTLLHLAGIDCLKGSLPDAESKLISAQNQIEALGILQPLVLVLSYQEDLINCLNDHLPENQFTKDLLLGIHTFWSQLPSLLESLKFNLLPYDAAEHPFLEIRSLGRVSLKRRGELVSVPEWTKQKTVRELFFFLLCRPEGASREEICLEFWPDSNPQQLKKQLKNALYRLRRAVGTDTIIFHQPSRLYHFNRDLDYCYDVEEFQRALQEAEGERDPEIKIRLLQGAAALYQHPFAPTLDGIWAEPVRYGLYLDFEDAILTIAKHQLSQGKPDSCLKAIEQLLQADPGQEAAWRLAMRSYAEKADRSGIERTFQRCRQALSVNLDAEPSEETFSLYQMLMI